MYIEVKINIITMWVQLKPCSFLGKWYIVRYKIIRCWLATKVLKENACIHFPCRFCLLYTQYFMYNPICENRKLTKFSNDSKSISGFDRISFCMSQSKIWITDVKITSAPKKVCKCLFKCNSFVAII